MILPPSGSPAPPPAGQGFVPRRISNCSCTCVRDIVFIVSGLGTAAAFSGLAADETRPTLQGLEITGAVLCAAASTLGIIYGIMIRACPRSQRFWLR